MTYKYAFQEFDKEKMARAAGVDLPISMKNSAMVCNAIRGQKLERAKAIVEDAIAMKKAIKFTRFNRDRAHQTKIGPGRFSVNTCKSILKILKSAEANAQQKGLNDLLVKHACAHLAARPYRYGRKRGQFKRAHVEIVLSEVEEKVEKEEKK